MPHERIGACRLCGWPGLHTVLDLGELAFCGYFPQRDEIVPRGPIEIVECRACGLAQIAHEYTTEEMYGDHYGYRSGLNPTMVTHLGQIARLAWRIAKPRAGDLVIDIGANDGTLLGFYPETVRRIGIDPLADKYARHYPRGALRMAQEFTAANAIATVGRDAARIVTSIACFYDFARPIEVAEGVAAILAPGGIWAVEQCTTDAIMRGSWDQIVHEHKLHYGMDQLLDIFARAGLKVIHRAHNAINGGSTLIIVQKAGVYRPVDEHNPIHGVREAPNWDHLAALVKKSTTDARYYLERARIDGRVVWGWGASTKGNVFLQAAQIGPHLLKKIVDANADKQGRVAPGTGIPIEYKPDAWRIGDERPDTMLVLPWHFADFAIEKERAFLESGGELVFALPELTVVTRDGRRIAA